MSEILVGTSGWNYPTGKGTWNGVFYPNRRPRGFDELRYYAEHFDTVEVNSTFYRLPEPAQTLSWLQRTPMTFTFSVKLYQKFTHPDMYLARPGVSEWDLSRDDVDLFRRGVEPLASADRLVAVLVQFPASFHAVTETRDYLDWLLRAFTGFALAVELRHQSWVDEATETARRLAAHGAAWALIDIPKTSGVTSALAPVDDAAAFTYLRLHGRNARGWWEHEEAEDRYDYLYSTSELQPFAAAATRAAKTRKKVLMYMNNHFSAKAVANAAVLKHQLGQPVPGEYPREMIDRYPDLAGIVTTSGLPL